jgi:lipopolysaccharide/colanic/teichoic acid biosynthesis glycosyltransferase
MQRLLDIFFSLMAILILIPLLAPIAVLLKFTGEGQVFFKQQRVGMKGEFFNLLKFATMQKNSPNVGSKTITLNNDPRILPVGRFLRKSKINELPQLLNILAGSMSVVGPRPLTEQTFNYYSSDAREMIKKLKPGLSGIQQIVIRDEERLMIGKNATSEFYVTVLAPYKGELEKWFAFNNNIRNYFLIILITLANIVYPNGRFVWRCFDNLPQPPRELKSQLNYIDNDLD